MNKIKISAVSYTNTKPFVYGLTHSEIINKIDLSLDIPSTCANKLIDNQVDIGLVPVAALLRIPNYEIISDYCIGADGAVNSVYIFSEKPIEEIETIRLDEQSRTSNNLALVLLKNYWKVGPRVVIGNADAFVQIGDRTFGKSDQYPYAYDLSQEWKKFTGLPFAFAVWAANKKIEPAFISEFNLALKFGLANREQIIPGLPEYKNFDLADYLMHKLDFNLDEKKKEAISKFLDLVKDL
ncbi:menaquinone biosynthetic enzyme MqnA/MqnD family protein [Daejeonella oryzae]|uniref:menaquinone biosynthetic enzyme MqnA/MqnD family protein n=1 Tax=Daejeonella oryzae TaxID=1122943 RepID=UPI000403DAFB|nr:menaquinone biosynthesis protein [Daejeonella oryzae]